MYEFKNGNIEKKRNILIYYLIIYNKKSGNRLKIVYKCVMSKYIFIVKNYENVLIM